MVYGMNLLSEAWAVYVYVTCMLCNINVKTVDSKCCRKLRSRCSVKQITNQCTWLNNQVLICSVKQTYNQSGNHQPITTITKTIDVLVNLFKQTPNQLGLGLFNQAN